MAINLIPSAVREKRQKGAVKRISFIGTFTALVGAVAVTAGVLFFKFAIKAQVTQLEKDIRSSKNSIKTFEDIELQARTIKKKASLVDKVISEEEHYSVVLEALTTSVPAEVSLTDLQITTPEKATVSGEVSNYLDLARFIRALLDEDKGGWLFTDVGVRSVGMGSGESSVKFDLEIGVDESLLRRGGTNNE